MVDLAKRSFDLKRFGIDAVACAIFWTILYTPVFLYTSKTLEAALLGLGSAAVLEILFGGVYGRFLDWFRKKSGVIPQKPIINP
jgi:hypothetical protein